MLPVPIRPTGHCIFCALRLAVRARKHSFASAAATQSKFVSDAPTFTITKHATRSPPERSNPQPDSSLRSGGRWLERGSRDGGVDDDRRSVVRKYGGASPLREEKEGDFDYALEDRLKELKKELKEAPLLEQLRREQEDNGEHADSFATIWRTFADTIYSRRPASIPKPPPWMGESTNYHPNSKKPDVMQDLRDAYSARGLRALDDQIKYAFYGHVVGARFTASDVANQKTLADLRYPTEWYPATRALHRTIHLHVGPTNSGKTYQALQRLEKADKGVYAGPLRLLAHEVYTRLNAKGKPCALVTGEERRAAVLPTKPDDNANEAGKMEAGVEIPRVADMSACTVEMVPLNRQLDVAVIDEIQMIGNVERGWAWTQALLGVQAREVHLCGEERAVPLIRELCASVGETLHVHRYERLSPLKMAEESLQGDLKRLRPGDCVVSFSVMGIHALRKQIENQTGRKVATVYGSLPPETRAQQARLFNDPNNEYDYLVASDAVGMGLNLAIKRIVFEASSKFDGVQRRTLGVADIKQIAGRAGRYRTAEQSAKEPSSQEDLSVAVKRDPPPADSNVIAKINISSTADQSTGPSSSDSTSTFTTYTAPAAKKEENVGLVTCLEPFDYPIIRAAMSATPEPIRTAGLYPPGAILERFSAYFPRGTPFSYILTRLHELSMMHSRFHLCGLREQLWIAELIEPVAALTVTDRNIFCSMPASSGEPLFTRLVPAYARCVAEQRGGALTDIEELPLEVLETELTPTREYLRDLERLHKGVVGYLWLSYRFAGIFTTRPLAFHVKELVEGRIEEVLRRLSFSDKERRVRAEARRMEMMAMMEQQRREKEAEATKIEALGVKDGPPEVPLDGDRFIGEEDVGLEDPEFAEETTQAPADLDYGPDANATTVAQQEYAAEDVHLSSPSHMESETHLDLQARSAHDSGESEGELDGAQQQQKQQRQQPVDAGSAIAEPEATTLESEKEAVAATPETDFGAKLDENDEAQTLPSSHLSEQTVPTTPSHSDEDDVTRLPPSASSPAPGSPSAPTHEHLDVEPRVQSPSPWPSTP